MLTQMRALSQSWIGRGIMAIVLGFIIVSFAVWGIGDRFTNFNASELAKVGAERITVDEYRNAFQTQLQRMQQQQKRGITNEEARRIGLDRQVLSRLLSDAILDQEAARLGLHAGDAEIAKQIVDDDIFKGASGKFDQMRFASLLRDNGLTEATYVKEQRRLTVRQDIQNVVAAGLDVPKLIENAVHRYQSEVRDIAFFVLPPSAAGEVPKPSEADIKRYYDDHSGAFVAPEFRKLVVLSVVPVNLVKPDAVTDADVKKRYEDSKDIRFGVPEKRNVQQLVFPDATLAEAAKAKLDKGESFDKLAADERKNLNDISLGTVAKSEISDKAVAEAAFALPAAGTSAPVKTQFGMVLVHIAKVEPGRQQPLMEVSAQIKDELAIVRARQEATRLRDKIEDQRTAGKTLTEAAQSVGLQVRTIDAIDAQGRDRLKKPVEGLVDGPTLLKAAFGSDIGADTEMIQTANGGDVWYEVAGIDASRKLPLADVKSQVEAGWRDDEVAKRLSALGEKLAKEINDGKPLRDVAAANGKRQVIRGLNIGRQGGGNLPPQLPGAIFDVPAGKAGSVAEQRDTRAIFKIEAAHVPPIDPKNDEFKKLMEQVRTGFQDDVTAQYLAQVQSEIGVKINQTALQSVLRQDPGS